MPAGSKVVDQYETVMKQVAIATGDPGGVATPVSSSNPLPFSAAALPLPSGAATEATLLATSAKLPGSLGVKTAANSFSIAPASDALFAVNTVANGTPTNRSGTVTTGGTSQTLMAANASRRGFSIQNLSTTDLYWNDLGTTAAATQPSYRLPAGAIYESPAHQCSVAAINIFGATTGQVFVAREF